MKFKVFGIVSIILTVFVANASNAEVQCSEGTIEKIIDGLGYDPSSSYAEELRCLAAYPSKSAKLLIAQLHIVSEKKISPEDASTHQSTMHVIWSIRGLRYITGGMDFTSETSVNKNKLGKPYWSLLTIRKKNELTFFGTRMSHDTIYLAPSDVQLSVIKQWKDWYAIDGQTYVYKPAVSNIDWYF